MFKYISAIVLKRSSCQRHTSHTCMEICESYYSHQDYSEIWLDCSEDGNLTNVISMANETGWRLQQFKSGRPGNCYALYGKYY